MKAKILFTAIFAFVLEDLGRLRDASRTMARTPKLMRFDNLNNYRYCELFLIGGDALTKDLQADFYNSTDLNGGAATRDSCPQAVWDKVDIEAVKKEYHVLGVFKNGPRFWMYDWIELPVGTERDFNGYHGRWFGKVQSAEILLTRRKKGPAAYHPTTVQRGSHQGYVKGQTGLQFSSDPSGTPWIMQAYSHIVDSKLDVYGSPNARQEAQTPAGLEVPGQGAGPRSRDSERILTASHGSFRTIWKAPYRRVL